MITFEATEETLYHPEIGTYIAFGIAAVQEEYRGLRTIIRHIADVFTDREKAESLARLCNEQKLDVRHLWDVVQDAV